MPAGPDFDALLMGSLYGELSAAEESRLQAHLAAHPGDQELLRSLRRTRELIRSSAALSAADPPQAISALLLQEAARRAPRVHAERGGVSASLAGRLTRWLAALAAHPGLAAAAMAVVAIGAAGTLYLRGAHEVAEPTASAPRAAERSSQAAPAAVTTAAPAAPVADPTVPTGGAPPAPAAASGSADSMPLDGAGRYDGKAETYSVGLAKDDLDLTKKARRGDSLDSGAAGDVVAQDLAPTGKKSAVARRPGEQVVGIPATTSDLDIPLKELDDEDARDAVADKREPSEPEVPAKLQQAEQMRRQSAEPDVGGADRAGALAPRAPAAASPLAAPAPMAAPVVANTRGAGALGPTKTLPSKQAKPSAPKPAQMQRDQVADEGLGPADSQQADVGTREEAASAPAQTAVRGRTVSGEATAKASSAYDEKWAKGEHVRLVRLARANKCSEAAQVAKNLAERAPRYYADRVAQDRELRACSTSIRDALDLRPDLKRKAAPAPAVDDVRR